MSRLSIAIPIYKNENNIRSFYKDIRVENRRRKRSIALVDELVNMEGKE